MFGTNRFEGRQCITKTGLAITLDKIKATQVWEAGVLAANVTPTLFASGICGEFLPSRADSQAETGTYYSKHASKTSRSAIEKFSLFSFEIRFFNIKLIPMATYNIELIREDLRTTQWCRLVRMKPAFLKKAQGLHRSMITAMCNCWGRCRYLLRVSNTNLAYQKRLPKKNLADNERNERLKSARNVLPLTLRWAEHRRKTHIERIDIR